VRCESNPALFTRCTILWMGAWRRDTMRAVPAMMDGVRKLILADGAGDGDDAAAAGAPAAPRAAERKGGEAKAARREGKSARGEGKGGEGKGRGGAAAPAPRGGGGGDAGGDVDDQLLEAIASMHESAAAASPREFVLFLENWRMLHDQMRGGIRTKLSHLSAGLAKLEEASATVDSLSNNAEVEQAKLVEAQKGADAAMEMITKTLSEATGRRGEVNDLKTEVTRREEHTISRQGEIKQELSSIQPVLETAKAAVGQIKAEHLNEIRSLKMPPEPIADVLGAVLKLLGISDVSWTSMKKFLGNRGVKDEILNYDARRIGGEMRKDVARLLKQKSTSFDQATITRVSVAAAPLAAWVKANIRYSVVLEKIQPLEAELARAEEDLAKCTLRLRQCEDEIATIDDRVAALKAEFGDKTREAEKLRARLALAEGTLDKAQHLLGKLSGEQARWQTQAGDLRSELASLPRQLLVAAGFLTYLSRCPEDAREAALADWTATVGLAAFDFTSLLATESRLLAWKQVGLPADPLSMENALVVAHNPGARVPFVIDPADAARAWLVAHYGGDDGRPLEVLQSADARFGTTVELAVRFGKTLLIFDVDARAARAAPPRERRRRANAAAARTPPRGPFETPPPTPPPRACRRLEPVLYPLARRDLAMNGPRAVVRVGDRTVDFHENFRLALVTRNPTPDLPPDAAALCTLVNFTVTRSGLEGQLLGATIQHEEPELETKKTAMLKQEEDYKIKLAGLETDLLEALATAEGDLLENALLIESLTRTKEASREISDALAASAEASATLDARREAYRGFSRDGSRLYFLVRDLVLVNPMYQVSLASFVRLFEAALRDGSVAADGALDDRLARLTPLLERLAFFFVGRGLFKADRCMFALHVVHGMHAEHFLDHEWELFTGELAADGAGDAPPDAAGGRRGRGRGDGDGAGRRPRGLPAWAGLDRAPAFANMAAHLGGLVRRLDLENAARWSRWARSPECERDFPPEAVRECTPFQRVLVTRCFRPDRLMSALSAFACEVLRVPSLSPPPLSFTTLYETETEARTPTLLITTAGADPSRGAARAEGRARPGGRDPRGRSRFPSRSRAARGARAPRSRPARGTRAPRRGPEQGARRLRRVRRRRGPLHVARDGRRHARPRDVAARGRVRRGHVALLPEPAPRRRVAAGAREGARRRRAEMCVARSSPGKAETSGPRRPR